MMAQESDFNDDAEAKSVYEDGIIVRYNKSGNVIGIDITALWLEPC